MTLEMQCPFFKRNNSLDLYCEGGVLKFPDSTARREYIIQYCANEIHWHKCTICRNLESYYERKEK